MFVQGAKYRARLNALLFFAVPAKAVKAGSGTSGKVNKAVPGVSLPVIVSYYSLR